MPQLHFAFRAFKLILEELLEPEKVGQLVDMRAGNGDTPFVVLCRKGRTRGHLKILLKMMTTYSAMIDFNATNEVWFSACLKLFDC